VEDRQLREEYTFIAPGNKKSAPNPTDKPAGVNIAAQLTDEDFDEKNPSYRFQSIRTHDDAIREKHQAELQQKQTKPAEEKPQAEKKSGPAESGNNCRYRHRGRWRR
jgi:hypothetical protein